MGKKAPNEYTKMICTIYNVSKVVTLVIRENP